MGALFSTGDGTQVPEHLGKRSTIEVSPGVKPSVTFSACPGWLPLGRFGDCGPLALSQSRTEKLALEPGPGRAFSSTLCPGWNSTLDF